MNSKTREALRLQYSLVRAPISLLHDRGLQRLSDSSPIKRTVALGLVGLDALADRFLTQPTGAKREETATASSELPESAPTEGDSAEEIAAERAHVADALVEEEIEEELAKPHVGELADADLDEKQRQAALRVKHQQAEQAEQLRAKERRAAADAQS